MTYNCSIHGTPMEWKEGVSKRTQKPYEFWACSKKSPDGSFCKGNPIQAEIVVAKSTAPAQAGIEPSTGVMFKNIIASLSRIERILEQMGFPKEVKRVQEPQIPIIDTDMVNAEFEVNKDGLPF